MTPLAAYLLLFTIVGIGFIFAHLIAGKLIRPSKPDAEKGTIYECGEPTIGSAWVQFDLRFYVVALLFVIFDVEVAFFFPWAEVFGKANAVATAKQPQTPEEYVAYAEKVQDLALPPGSANDKALERYEKITGRRADGKAILDEDRQPMPALPAQMAHKDWDEDPRSAALQEVAKEKNRKKVALTKEEAQALESDGPLKTNEFKKNAEAASSLAWAALIEVLVFFGVLLVGFAYLWRRGDLEWVRSTAAERLEARGVSPPPSVPPAPVVRETAAAAGPH